MHVKITTSGPRRYVQLVESFRDDEGRIRKRTVATLGRLGQVGDSLDAVINGLLKATGRQPVVGDQVQPEVRFESARALGSVWALDELWKALGFDTLRWTFRRTRRRTDVEALIGILVFNRLCDPESKLGVLRWLETMALPDMPVAAVSHQQLLRSMDALIAHRVMRSRLKAASCALSPDRALEQLARIQHHRIQIAQSDPMTGVSTIATDQAQVFSALGAKKPAASQQLSLL